MSNLLTREQIMADFTVNVYPSLKKIIGDDLNEAKHYFKLHLLGHFNDKNISEHQCKTWVLNKSDL